MVQRTVEQPTKAEDLSGAVRGRKTRTMIPDEWAVRATDLADRDFVAPTPNRRWIADFPPVVGWVGTVYVAFVVDTCSHRIVNRSATRTEQSDLALSSLEMTGLRRPCDRLEASDREPMPRADGGERSMTGSGGACRHGFR